MRFTKREKLNGTVEEVHALLIDPAFQDAKCAATTRDGVYTVDIGGGGGGHRVRTERQLPTDELPDMARSFVGDKLTIVEVLDWSALGPEGSRASIIDIHVKGAPLNLKGTVRLEPHGDETLELIDADLTANVPLIGSKLERAAAVPINAAIRIEIELLREWLAR